MERMYRVAESTFRVRMDEAVRSWQTLEPRFRPFTAESDEQPELEIDVRAGALPVCAAERIYEPEHGGVGFITARASRRVDGSLIMEFRHIDESEQRLWMLMPEDFSRAEIVIAEAGDWTDHYFLTHAMMLAFMLATSDKGTLLIHASSVVCRGKGYLFQGKSGTGKSTHARLWTENVAGAELLNDDNPFIRFTTDGEAMVYGSPWSGKTHCYRNVAVHIGGVVRVVRGPENELLRLNELQGYASLTTSVFFLPFMNERQREARHWSIERLAMTVGCYEMHCRPDAEAAIVCSENLV